MAMQDVLLWSDTIDGNIAFGNSDMPEEDVHRFAHAADADNFIANKSRKIFLNVLFRFQVNGGGGVVQYQNCRAYRQCSGKGFWWTA